MITNQEKLDILNSMEIIDEDGRGSEIIYVNVNYSDENIEKISKIVPDINEYLKSVGDPDGTKDGIDISIASFQYAEADYYKGKFVIFTKEQILELYEDEKSKRIKVENELKNFTTQINYGKVSIQEALKLIG
ncbi:hypothetical protein D0439_10080 [Lysinibacillus fusiformis]|uniref:hypothetical protein n=1 Tax=Lysinibacillus fusiformis TaxID=28031 RepID=UPI0011BB93A2|nr:hypothetical protein [Lysinibacillus fusiformis]QDZ98959.1 hypothetical protein D0439_10080 [Lysinibacillus fusiformis]